MPQLRPSRVVKFTLISVASLWAYQFGCSGTFDVTQASLRVSRLGFPKGTFNHSVPFFFETDRPASLFVASAPPDAVPSGSKVWQLAASPSGIRVVEADPAAAVPAYRPVPNGLSGAENGLPTPCTNGSGKDLGGVVVQSAGLQIQMRFVGVHFRKPVLVLFSMDGGTTGPRMLDVYFGKRTIDVCRGDTVAASFSQRLWNVPSAVRLPDMAYMSAEHRMLLITGDAALSNALLAMRY
ncbi:MAG: hypothetical protein M1570_12270 [Chloroflexi bacterium]|nr:hypothetical protein [Chloroflexota bacterium]